MKLHARWVRYVGTRAPELESEILDALDATRLYVAIARYWPALSREPVSVIRFASENPARVRAALRLLCRSRFLSAGRPFFLRHGRVQQIEWVEVALNRFSGQIDPPLIVPTSQRLLQVLGCIDRRQERRRRRLTRSHKRVSEANVELMRQQIPVLRR